MRAKAARATPGPWEAFRRGNPDGPFGVAAESVDVFDGGTRANADYIAVMSPSVALAVADWLEKMAGAMVGTSYGDLPFEAEALAVADAFRAD